MRFSAIEEFVFVSEVYQICLYDTERSPYPFVTRTSSFFINTSFSPGRPSVFDVALIVVSHSQEVTIVVVFLVIFFWAFPRLLARKVHRARRYVSKKASKDHQENYISVLAFEVFCRFNNCFFA